MSELRMTRAVLLTVIALIAAGTLSVVGPADTAHAVSDRVWNRLAQCESGGRWHINTNTATTAVCSSAAPTRRRYLGGKFARFAHRATQGEQIRVAERVRRSPGWGAWPSCSQHRPALTARGSTNWIGPAFREGRPGRAMHPFARQLQTRSRSPRGRGLGCRRDHAVPEACA